MGQNTESDAVRFTVSHQQCFSDPDFHRIPDKWMKRRCVCRRRWTLFMTRHQILLSEADLDLGSHIDHRHVMIGKLKCCALLATVSYVRTFLRHSKRQVKVM